MSTLTSIFAELTVVNLCTHVYSLYERVQWNLSITDTLGTTRSVLIRGVSSFQRLFCTHLYAAGTVDSDLIKEVSLFRRSVIERFYCTAKSKCRPRLCRLRLLYGLGKNSDVSHEGMVVLQARAIAICPTLGGVR